jgi:hypothetical protein
MNSRGRETWQPEFCHEVRHSAALNKLVIRNSLSQAHVSEPEYSLGSHAVGAVPPWKGTQGVALRVRIHPGLVGMTGARQ